MQIRISMKPTRPGTIFGKADLSYKPTTTYPPNPDPKLPPARYWMIDGKRQVRFIRSDVDSGTTVDTRELLDVKARLKHMDELGTDIQVIYPTLFLDGSVGKTRA